MPYIRPLVVLAFSLSLFSCSDSTDKQLKNTDGLAVNDKISPKPAINLSGKVYFFAPDLDSTTCKVSGACDCCTYNLLFINDTEFIDINYCEADEGISKGTYLIVDDQVELNYQPVCVAKEYDWTNDADTTVKATYDITAEKSETHQSKLTRLDCKNVICFKSVENTTFYGVPDNKEKLSKYIKDLKAEGVWQKLEMK